jgi:hypothetical protein
MSYTLFNDIAYQNSQMDLLLRESHVFCKKSHKFTHVGF